MLAVFSWCRMTVRCMKWCLAQTAFVICVAGILAWQSVCWKPSWFGGCCSFQDCSRLLCFFLYRCMHIFLSTGGVKQLFVSCRRDVENQYVVEELSQVLFHAVRDWIPRHRRSRHECTLLYMSIREVSMLWGHQIQTTHRT